MKRYVISTKWIRLVAAAAMATPLALALSYGSSNAALEYGSGELGRFEIDGDAVPGVSSNGAPANPFVNGDWGLVEADFGYGPQPIGSNAADDAPAGIGSTGTLPLVFAQSRADDFPTVSPAPNPQYPTVPGSLEFCPDGEDDNWEGGAKVESLINIDDPLDGPGDDLNLGCGQTLDKGNLFRAYAAYEVVAVPNIYGDPLSGSQNHTILYGAWERGDVPGELNFYIPVADSIPGNSAGDRLIAFDYDSSSPATYRILSWDGADWVVASSGNAGDNSTTFQAAVGYTAGTLFPANGQPSFGEFALDLTASGVLSNTEDGACVELMTAGYIFTETGNSSNAQLKDYVGAPRLPIGNCGQFDVSKIGPANAALAPEFGYRSEQDDLEAIFPTVTMPVGQTYNRIDDLIQIGETDRWTDVFAQPDYLVFEPDPLVTNPPTPGWSQTTVECTYVDAFTAGFPIVTDRLVYDGTTHVIGEYLQVQSSAFLTLAGHGIFDPATGDYTGFVPSCRITNDAAGIIIEKAGAGDLNQVFSFDAGGQLADLAIGESAFLAFDEGTPVTILEAPLVGADPAWDLTSIECFNEGAVEPFISGDPALGEVTIMSEGPTNTIRCVFTNVQRGSITIEKQAVPALSQYFQFETTMVPGGTLALADGDSVTFSDLTPGPYSIDELETLGWNLTGLTCTSGLGTSQYQTSTATGVADITLAAGDAVACLYTNEAISGELTIEKVITGAIDDTFAWSFGFELSDPGGVVGTGNITGIGTVPDDTLVFTNLVPGTTYTLAEWEMPPGWTANGMTCSVMPPLATQPIITTDGSFTVLPGSTVACGFDNSPDPGELTIEKVITGAIDDTFAWSFGFELSDPGGVVGTGNITGVGTLPDDTLVFTNLVPGTTYTVTETVPSGWTANTVGCTVTPAVPEGLLVTTTDGSFTVIPGSTVLCTFDNTPDPGMITLAKTTAGGDGDFTFAIAAASGPPIEVVVTTSEGSGVAVLAGLVPGTTYTVVEIDPGPSWIAGDLLCTVEHADGSSNVYQAAGFTVLPGDSVACGLTNTERGLIIVDKVTVPGDDTTAFDFTVAGDAVDTFTVTGPGDPYTTGLVPPGTYTVTELAEPGWVFQGAVCDSGGATVDGAAATIELAPGEVVTCTFANARRGPLTITKTVTEGPTRTDVDTYQLTYQLVVGSQSHVDEVYDLVDEVLFGEGITVMSALATGPAGVSLEAGWNGMTATLLVDDATIGALGTHQFTIVATGLVDLMSTADSRDCVLATGENGTGFLNDATVTWLDGSASDDACEDTPEPDVADLAIVKTASVTTTGPDGTFNWVLDITNNGPAAAVNVVVGDLVPSQVKVTAVTSSQFTCGFTGNTVSCTKAAMAVGETGQVTITVVVPAAAVSGSVTNIGTVESDTPDPDLTNNSDDATVDIVKQLAPTTTTTTAILPETGSGSTSGMTTAAAWLSLIGGAALLMATRRRIEDLETG